MWFYFYFYLWSFDRTIKDHQVRSKAKTKRMFCLLMMAIGNDCHGGSDDDYHYDDHLTAEVLYEGQRLPPLVAHQAYCALVNHCRKIMIKMKIINHQKKYH